MQWKAVEQFLVPHNYLDISGILRKGAISARQGERVEERQSRTESLCTTRFRSFKKQMKGIYSSSVGAKTLDVRVILDLTEVVIMNIVEEIGFIEYNVFERYINTQKKFA